MNLLLFSIGAAIGAPLRFWIDNLFRPKYKFPIGIFIVNISGSFFIGLIASGTITNLEYLLLGFCGALTTWSTFMVDLYFGIKNRHLTITLVNLLISILLGYLAFLLAFSMSNS
jgi:CrcB protein